MQTKHIIDGSHIFSVRISARTESNPTFFKTNKLKSIFTSESNIIESLMEQHYLAIVCYTWWAGIYLKQHKLLVEITKNF